MARHNQILSLVFLFTLTACVNTRKATNFNDLQDGVLPTTVAFTEPDIQKGDILSITISSQNPDATKIFNAPVVTPDGTNTMGSGYLVNSDGQVQLPVLGLVKAEGLSKKSLGDGIRQTLLDKKLLVDPVVTIRHLNYRVTVLGEVSRPAVINVPSERITVLEALGMAGDLTIYAKRDNILLIRDEAGKRSVKRLDLTDKDFLTSPFYYLRPNDVLYVEPNKAKVATSTRSQVLLPAILGGLSFLAIVADRIFR
ncbi:polysaccharide biosynthesis/export family protein [Flavisolibacter sp. BT320]|nr:polysaccharide biosynthesis/export family protein [Flavisolibacter longurius]